MSLLPFSVLNYFQFQVNNIFAFPIYTDSTQCHQHTETTARHLSVRIEPSKNGLIGRQDRWRATKRNRSCRLCSGLACRCAMRPEARHTHTPVAIATDQAHFQTVEETNKQKVSDFKTETTPFRSSLLTN